MSATIDTYQRLAQPGMIIADRLEIMTPRGGTIHVYTCDQDSQEWKDLHLGRPTASQFSRIVQPGGETRIKKDGKPYKSGKGELAEGRWGYLYELAVERLLNQPRAEIGHLKAVERGKMMEPHAVQQYEFINDRKTVKLGFICPEHGKWGCSPDRLMCDDPMSGLEFKAPNAETHLKYWNEGLGPDYRCQLQGSMLITGFPKWEFVSYHPNLPQVSITVPRDQEFCEKLEVGLTAFCAELDKLEKLVREEGVTLPSAAPAANDIDGWRKIMDADPGAWAIG